ncbi:single-stranded DNA-binding protein, mitochondrial [Bombus terrestris]|uniref:Single-stranded DNA-binding protein, mitochondrial n=1 Tax=Bombus terrestris TaxID=30195 RepID=A0A9B2JQ12_BOMTE|nr:single-stranded DNA-binding protein, mitochondrial [Bombus terrestris]XP_012173425.1 single-stranded DNA-binding protein, mitochondrial [Bombus terrestris]XP_020723122.1 single-stranded DNA-binding protein, mitochondrial [Bombus terrestris]
MLRQVIPRIVQNIQKIEKRQLSAASIENTKLEKTINQVTLLGRVGSDAQKRGTEDHPVVIFSLATHSNYRYMNGDFVQRTEWHRICIFKPALRDTVLNYLKKGQRVYVLGKINYGEFKDEEGVVKPSTSVIADDVIFFQS